MNRFLYPSRTFARRRVQSSPQKILGKVLVGTADPRLRRRLSRFLRRWADTVECCLAGRECFEMAMNALSEGEPFDLILVDTDLPVLDAYSVTSLLRDNDYPATIISFSGDYFPMYELESEEAGCNGHLHTDTIEQTLPGFFAYESAVNS